MSIESRLQAKKRSQKARQKEKIKKTLKIVGIILIPCIIAGIAIGVYLHKQDQIIDYSEGLTADGKIEGITDLSEYVQVCDYKNTGIKKSDYEPTDEDIEKAIKTALEQIGKDTKADKAPEKLTDELVKEHLAEEMGDDYEPTVEGYQQYLRDTLYETNLEGLENDIADYLMKNSTANKYPESYVKAMARNNRNEEIAAFEAYSSLYALYGYTSVYSMYNNSKKEFRAAMEASARNMVKYNMITQYIFEKEGLSITEDAMQKYYTDELKQDYNDLLTAYGKPYLTQVYMQHLVTEHLATFVPEK